MLCCLVVSEYSALNTCKHACAHRRACAHKHNARAHACTYMHACTNSRMHTHTHAHRHALTRTCTHAKKRGRQKDKNVIKIWIDSNFDPLFFLKTHASGIDICMQALVPLLSSLLCWVCFLLEVYKGVLMVCRPWSWMRPCHSTWGMLNPSLLIQVRILHGISVVCSVCSNVSSHFNSWCPIPHHSTWDVKWKMCTAYRASFRHILKKMTVCFSSSVCNSKCF